MAQYKSNSFAFKTLLIFLTLFLITKLVYIYCLIVDSTRIAYYIEEQVFESPFDSYYHVEYYTTYTHEILAFFFSILFIIWIRYSYKNLNELTGSMRHNPNWMVICLFFPIVSFIVPFQMIKELINKIDSILSRIETALFKKTNIVFVGFYWFSIVLVSTSIFVLKAKLQEYTEDAESMLSLINIILYCEIFLFIVFSFSIKAIVEFGRKERFIFNNQKQISSMINNEEIVLSATDNLN